LSADENSAVVFHAKISLNRIGQGPISVLIILNEHSGRGLLLLSGYFVPIALILLAAELYNILAFHLMFESGSGSGLLACVLWVLVFLQYRANFNSILTRKPASQP
jgi:hypothetical protein